MLRYLSYHVLRTYTYVRLPLGVPEQSTSEWWSELVPVRLRREPVLQLRGLSERGARGKNSCPPPVLKGDLKRGDPIMKSLKGHSQQQTNEQRRPSRRELVLEAQCAAAVHAQRGVLCLQGFMTWVLCFFCGKLA